MRHEDVKIGGVYGVRIGDRLTAVRIDCGTYDKTGFLGWTATVVRSGRLVMIDPCDRLSRIDTPPAARRPGKANRPAFVVTVTRSTGEKVRFTYGTPEAAMATARKNMTRTNRRVQIRGDGVTRSWVPASIGWAPVIPR